MGWAGKFLHGPRMWLWGEQGHAFFRAAKDLGMKASPRCPESSSKALLLQTSRQFSSDYVQKLRLLEVAAAESSVLPAVQCLEIMKCGPYYHSRTINIEADRLNFTQHICTAKTRTDIDRIAYDMFFR